MMSVQLQTQRIPNSDQAFSPALSGFLQRKCACGSHAMAGVECAECRNNRLGLQRKEINRSKVSEVPPIVTEALHSPGQPLDAVTRAFMEPRFGRDLSRVRVHTGGRAGESARAVGALAYTVGQNVVFGDGQYAPGTGGGGRLLAHELAHTVQQGGAVAVRPRLAIGPADDAAEREADRAAAAVTEGMRAPVVTAADPALRRQGNGSSVRSPVFEEAVTQLSDLAGATSGRSLSGVERALVRTVFGASIDYSRVRLVPADALEYRTVGNNIYVPHNFNIDDVYMAQTLIHELTHVWQYQHYGTSYISRSLADQIGAAVTRGARNFAYDYTIQAGQSFFDFAPEQQGLMVENYFAMLRDQSTITTVAAAGAPRTYQSNHMGSDGFRRSLSAAGRQAEISHELPLHEPLMRQMQSALPHSELSILQLRASEVIHTPHEELFPVPEEWRVMPVRPLFQLNF